MRVGIGGDILEVSIGDGEDMLGVSMDDGGDDGVDDYIFRNSIGDHGQSGIDD